MKYDDPEIPERLIEYKPTFYTCKTELNTSIVSVKKSGKNSSLKSTKNKKKKI
jgi:hypothetical protein